MAASGESGASGGGSTEEAFMTFYSEVKQIEKRDSVLTSKNQIERLTRPGSSYFNLNPFEVLQIDPEVTDEEIKKRFRQLSILVHPDKNQDDAERAQKAFEAVDKAYKLLLDQEQKKRALDVIQAGKEYVEHTVKERKKQLKKEGKPTNVEEDDPELFKQAVYKQTMKLFAELEIKRKEREAKEMHERDLNDRGSTALPSSQLLGKLEPICCASIGGGTESSRGCMDSAVLWEMPGHCSAAKMK
uniref:DnaJ homolog subfamily C member 8 n=1 Tax=Sarcophilus harrisii TaxID=9305 RepID=A0A7N4PYR6_SARHA